MKTQILKNSFGYNYQFFGQINKIFQIFFMVNYYYTLLMQITLCQISSSFCLVFLYYYNPYNFKKEYVMALISNFFLSSIILITISFAFSDKIILEFFIPFFLIAILIEFFCSGFWNTYVYFQN
ncbi:unnamed protein product [Paramecium pentaurelia]|uniref:Transmembrane protein n=1 Tax=Paramecium pentaurelia TaxID=43138 RepID=A0A8S1Y8H8_9CILI|nr:unnamed protein product [Paramecium pentaurelia]